MRQKFVGLFTISLLWGAIHPLSAQIGWKDFNFFTRYSVKDGLHSNWVSNVVEDQKGFIWVLTSQGIAVFDGNSFLNFTTYLEDGTQKPIRDPWELVFDDDTNMMYLTSMDGVLCSKRDSISFQKISEIIPSMPFDIGISRSLHLDDKKCLWVGTAGDGLFKLDLRGDDHEKISFKPDRKGQLTSEINQIYRIAVDDQDIQTLWLGTEDGLIEFNKTLASYRYHYYDENRNTFQNTILEVKPWRDKVFIGTPNAGWFSLYKNRDELIPVFDKTLNEKQGSIKGFHVDRKGRLWITSSRELVEYDIERRSLVNISFNDLKEEKVYGITLIDSRGIIWYASGNGLFKYNPNQWNRFLKISKKGPLEEPTMPLRIEELKGYYYLCPYYGEGLYKISPEDFSYEIFPIPVLKYRKDDGYIVRDMIAMDSSRLIILGNKKAVIFNTDSETFEEPVPQIPSDEKIYVRSIAKDKENNFWVATNLDGLYRFDYAIKNLTKYKEIFKGKTSRDHKYIKRLFVDSRNHLWLGQASTSVLDLQDTTLICFDPSYDREPWFPYGGFLEDGQRRIWSAHFFKGISYLFLDDYEKGFTKVAEGSFSDFFEYNDSLIFTLSWKDRQLGILNTNKKEHRLLNLNYQAPVTGAVRIMGGGNVMIGCENGLLIYNPALHADSKESPVSYIQEIRANNQLVYRGCNLDKKAFKLPSGVKSLNLRIGALAFQDPKGLVYKYRIGQEWIEIGVGREIVLANLKQGFYRLDLMMSTNSDDRGLIQHYEFVVRPFWYTSDLAYFFYALLLCTVIFGFYRVQMAQKMAKKEAEKMRQVEAFKSTLFANISHELRTPLTVIKGLAGRLIKVEVEPKDRGLVAGIAKNSDQLMGLVNQVLDFTRLEARMMKVYYKNGDVIAFIKKCVALYRSFADSRCQKLRFRSEVKKLVMDFDDEKLQTILNNLLSNALKFTPAGGTVEVQVKQGKSNLQIIVADNGIGIQKSELNMVFNRFYKTDNRLYKKGCGIGLALTNELVKLLHGKIEVQSEVNKGTRFTVYLPIQNNSQDGMITHQFPFIEPKLGSYEQVTAELNKEKMPLSLVVEDNPDIRKFISDSMESHFRVVTAKNGHQALQMLKKRSIDLVVSDIIMPKMDGLALCSRIKSDIKTSHIPFICLSARATSEDRKKAYNSGADAYLSKPFSEGELITITLNLIQKCERRKQNLMNLLDLKKPSVDAFETSNRELELMAELQKLVLGGGKVPSMDVLARRLGTSRVQLHRKIKSLTGMSTTQYINHIRVEKAKHLLSKSDLNVEEIAYEVGFESAGYFIKLFKKETAITPAAYRQRKASSPGFETKIP